MLLLGAMGFNRKLGEILVRYYRVPELAVNTALGAQKLERVRLGDILIRLNAVHEEDLVRALAFQRNMPAAFCIAGSNIAADILGAIPPHIVAWERVVPISRTKEALMVATAEPRDAELVEELSRFAKCRVQLVLTTEAEITAAIKRFYTAPAARAAVPAAAPAPADPPTVAAPPPWESEDSEEYEATRLSPPAQAPGAPIPLGEIEWDTVTGI